MSLIRAFCTCVLWMPVYKVKSFLFCFIALPQCQAGNALSADVTVHSFPAWAFCVLLRWEGTSTWCRRLVLSYMAEEAKNFPRKVAMPLASRKVGFLTLLTNNRSSTWFPRLYCPFSFKAQSAADGTWWRSHKILKSVCTQHSYFEKHIVLARYPTTSAWLLVMVVTTSVDTNSEWYNCPAGRHWWPDW